MWVIRTFVRHLYSAATCRRKSSVTLFFWHSSSSSLTFRGSLLGAGFSGSLFCIEVVLGSFWWFICFSSSVTSWWLCFLFSLSSSTNRRPLLSRSRPLCFLTSHSPSVASSLCRLRTPASAPTLASQTASMARRHAVGQRRWTSTATRCTSATILTRRYGLICLFPLVVSVGAWWTGFGADYGDFLAVQQSECHLHTDEALQVQVLQ